MKRLVYILGLVLILFGCKEKRSIYPLVDFEEEVTKDALKSESTSQKKQEEEQKLALQMQEAGLVNVQEKEPSIAVKLVYATPYNFTGQILYAGLKDAWLHPQAATMLIKAQKRLKSMHPELNIIVYDAARPLSVQQYMWKLTQGSDMRKYIADPSKGGGLHNYGMAVDVSLMDCTGQPLSMGGFYDQPGEISHTTDEDSMLAAGALTKREYDNRILLRTIMTDAGFKTIAREWWHFNACTLAEAQEKYKLIE